MLVAFDDQQSCEYNACPQYLENCDFPLDIDPDNDT